MVALCKNQCNLSDVAGGSGLIYRESIDGSGMAEKDGKAMGARIRKFRELSGLSQTELGEKLGVSYQQVQKYERGVSRLSVETLLRLARALDQPVGAFLPSGANVGGAEGGQVSEPRPDYAAMSKEEKEMVKAYRELADEKVRSAFLATLKAAAGAAPAPSAGSRKH